MLLQNSNFAIYTNLIVVPVSMTKLNQIPSHEQFVSILQGAETISRPNLVN
jgi:hypothetical protein